MSSAPIALSPLVAGIPEELISRRQWVCWRWAQVGDRWTKEPIDPHTGKLASTTDPATWDTFQVTYLASIEMDLAGIGFVFTDDDAYCGWDLDKCREPTTGTIATWALPLLASLASYAEVSPSGTGIKIIGRATLPTEKTGGRKPYATGNVEAYHRRRFFTVTGHRLDNAPTTINDIQAAVDSLYPQIFGKEPPRTAPSTTHSESLSDDEVLAHARSARNASKFLSLWSGDTSLYHGDDSEADLALCSVLAFWTQDSAQIDRLFRRSGLMRPKWERPDYRAGTINKALSRGDVWSGQNNPPSISLNGYRDEVVPDSDQGISLADLQRKAFAPIRWTVDRVMSEGACLMAAKPKSKKSWLALSIGLAVAMGGLALGQYSVYRGTVLYLDLEGNQRRIQSRVRSILGPDRVPWPSNFYVYTEWGRGDIGLAQLRVWIEEHPDTQLIVIDVLQDFRAASDPKANIYEYDRNTVKAINSLAEEFQITILLVHHTRKMKSEDVFDEVSGSTGLTSAVATTWILSKANDGQHTKLSLQGRDLYDDDPLALLWDTYSCTFKVAGNADDVAISEERKSILRVLDDDQARTPRQIAEELGTTAHNVAVLLGHLLRDGRVDKTGYGKYTIVRRPVTQQDTYE